MSDSFDRERRDERLVDYLLGDLEGEERRDLERRLASDAGLARDASGLRAALAAMPYGAAEDPPASLRARVLGAALAESAQTAKATPIGRRRSPAVLWKLVGAVAALLALGVGLDDVRLRRELELQREATLLLGQPNVVLSFGLRGAGWSLAARGSVLLDLDARRAALAVHGLPPAPRGQIYRLWARVGEKNIPCGQFDPSRARVVSAQFPIPVDAYTSPIAGLYVTLEPESLPAEPVGRTVMTST